MNFKGKTNFYKAYKNLKEAEKKQLENEIEYNLLKKLKLVCNYNKDIDTSEAEEVKEIRILLKQFKCFNSLNYVTYLEYFYNWLYHWNHHLINKDTFEKDIDFVKQYPDEWHRLLPHYFRIAKRYNYYKKNNTVYDRKVIEFIRKTAGKKNVTYKSIELALNGYKKREGLIRLKTAF